jgi:hypothetical protein
MRRVLVTLLLIRVVMEFIRPARSKVVRASAQR